MKHALTLLLWVAIAACAFGQSNPQNVIKISALPSVTTVGANDILPIDQGIGTTPVTRQVSISQLASYLQGSVSLPESAVTGLTTDLSTRVLNTVQVNGHALSSNITISASDLTTGTLPVGQLPGSVVLTSTTINGHPLSSNVTVSSADVLPSQTGNTGKYLTTNGSAVSWASVSAGGGLTNITESLGTASPNNTINVEALTVTGGATNTAVAVVPKGTGYFSLALPDGTATGGNARGLQSVDLQMSRYASTQVAGSSWSFVGAGLNNTIDTASTEASIGGGRTNLVTHSQGGVIGGGESNSLSFAFGSVVGGGSGNGIAGGYAVIAGGSNNSSSGVNSAISGGSNNTAAGTNSAIAGGTTNIVTGTAAWIPGGTGAVATQAQGSWASGYFNAAGDAQSDEWVLRCSVPWSTNQEMYLDGGATEITLPNNAVVQMIISIVGTTSASSGTTEAFGGIYQVVVQTDPYGNPSNLGSTPIGSQIATGSMVTPYFSASGSSFQIFSGYSSAGNETYWVARVIGVQVIFP